MMQTKSPSDFMAEASETVEELAQALERLDVTQTEDSDPELLNLIFRKAHSLKGLSSLGGQEKLVQTAHILEDALDALRMGKVALDDALYDALVDSVDVMSELISATAPNEETGFAFERAVRWADRVGTLLASSAQRSKKVDSIEASGLDPAIRGVLTEYEEHRLIENLNLGVPLRLVHAKLGLDAFDSGWNDLMSYLREVGEVLATLPSVEGSDENHVGFNILWASRQNVDRLADQFKSLSVSVTSVASKPAPAPEPVKAPKQIRTGAPDVPQAATLRIDLAKLDRLMTAVGDLILTRTNLKRTTDTTRAGQTLQAQTVDRLARETRALERKLDELQRGLLEARMVPLRHVFERLIRMVPRLLKEADKEIDFEIAGGDVQLDKVIADELLEPLVHLLRNAIDHGIESAGDRKKQGKSEEGLIRLSATNQGNHVVIDITDDGRGMDESKIRAEAVARGLASVAKAKELKAKDLYNLVFLPGFSTRKGATEWSGRGVGLDVVKTNLQKLSGVINIESEKGKGTRFELTLPVTLSIVRALVIRVAEEVFAIPVNAVLEIISVRRSELVTVDRLQMLKVRGQTVPMVRLAQLFQLPFDEVDRHLVVLLGLAQHRLALAVDGLIGQQDVVTKPLSPRLASIPGFAATADLGDHRAVLVLDVPQLVNEVLQA